jgi:hypothetical protein
LRSQLRPAVARGPVVWLPVQLRPTHRHPQWGLALAISRSGRVGQAAVGAESLGTSAGSWHRWASLLLNLMSHVRVEAIRSVLAEVLGVKGKARLIRRQKLVLLSD